MNLRRSFTAAALTLALLASSAASWAFVTVGLSITVAPPELPIYEQPPVPGPGFIWVPGYWAWSDGGYYWVPGTWVEPPRVGLLWTPGYWGWVDGFYVWNPGYWGPVVGFYGGVDYGFGYIGVGYAGGYWDHGAFFYNRAANNIPGNVHITNVYNRTVVNNITINRVSYNRVSYNGGEGGIHARPTPAERAAARQPHIQPAFIQRQHEQIALHDPQLRASFNHGRPPIAATPRAATFSGRGVIAPSAGPAGPQSRHAPGQPAQIERHGNDFNRPGAGVSPQAPNREFNAPHPSAPRSIESRPMEPRPVAPRPMESRPMESRPIAPRPAEPRPMPPPSSGTRYIPERRPSPPSAPREFAAPREAPPQSGPRGGTPHGEHRPNARAG